MVDNMDFIISSYNHFVNDLGINPTVDDILKDIYKNFTNSFDPIENGDYEEIKKLLLKLKKDGK